MRRESGTRCKEKGEWEGKDLGLRKHKEEKYNEKQFCFFSTQWRPMHHGETRKEMEKKVEGEDTEQTVTKTNRERGGWGGVGKREGKG